MMTDDDTLTPARLRCDLDEIAGLADALALIADREDERTSRAIASLACEISRRIDALYDEVHEAMSDPASFMGAGKRKGR
jgi:hypothetical protein